MSEYGVEIEPVGPEHGDYVLMITPYTQEDEVLFEAVVSTEGEAAIDDAFKTALEARAFERYGGRKAFEEHVLGGYFARDVESEWVQPDQLVMTGPKASIEKLSEQMEPEAFTHYVFDQQGFTEYVMSLPDPEAEGDVEVSLGADEQVLVVTPYSPEISQRMQLAGMDGSVNNPHVREAFTAEAQAHDPDFSKFRDTVSDCVVRHGLTVHFGGEDFVVLGGDPDALLNAECELDEQYSSHRHTGAELQDVMGAHDDYNNGNGPQGGGAGGLH